MPPKIAKASSNFFSTPSCEFPAQPDPLLSVISNQPQAPFMQTTFTPQNTVPLYALGQEELEIAAQSNPDAKFLLAYGCENGTQGCRGNGKKSARLFTELLRDAPSSAGALCKQGLDLQNGDTESRVKDPRAAAEKFHIAYELMNFIPAGCLLANLDKKRPDYGLLREIAQKYNCGLAKRFLAQGLFSGESCEKNQSEAARLYQDIADRHQDALGKVMTGYCYYNGWGVNKDFSKAEKYLKLAIEQDFNTDHLKRTVKHINYDKVSQCGKCLNGAFCFCFGLTLFCHKYPDAACEQFCHDPQHHPCACSCIACCGDAGIGDPWRYAPGMSGASYKK